MTTQIPAFFFATLLGSTLALTGAQAAAATQAGQPPEQAVQPQNPEETPEEIKRNKKKKQQQEQAEQQRADEERKRHQQDGQQQQQGAVDERKRQQQEQQRQQQQQQQQQRAVEERQRLQQEQQEQQRLTQQQEKERQKQLEDRQKIKQLQDLQARQAREREAQQQKRVSRQEQQDRIRREEQQLASYRRNIALREELAERDAQILRQQKRIQHLRFQEQYEDRLRAQRASLNRARYDYDNDPFYYTAQNYRYRRGDNYHRTNQYGIKQLERAMQSGYNEGFQTGRADRQDRWKYDYQSAFAYRDANYGYDGRYVDQDEYNHYFREGFERGYEDGYYNRNKYGRKNNSSSGINDEWLIAGGIVAAIIGYEILTD